ncbi:hypothetical protein [Streptomyces anandii]|uniref:hypothetical protein n=1 Tax=Streptomyces anandii TaxID=285454 RepID=UPI0016740E17|nr:hypothetical protein [Streptomyces anandii]GGX94687.1 hypothetical protein GCM10010510_44870 [Streptomyces anandii JCM 4720]
MSDDVIRTHFKCGLKVYCFPVNAARSTVTWRYVNLDAVALPEPVGDVDLTEDDEAVIGVTGTGVYQTHQCPARVVRCRRCGDPIIKVTRRYDGSRWRFTLLDAIPDPNGRVTLDENGHATTDLAAYPDGERYRLHHDAPAPRQPRRPTAPGLTRHAPPGLRPSSVTQVSRGDREST